VWCVCVVFVCVWCVCVCEVCGCGCVGVCVVCGHGKCVFIMYMQTDRMLNASET